MATSNRNFKFSRGGVGRWSSGPSLNWQFVLFLMKFMTGFYLINIFYRFGLSYYSYKRRQAERRRAFIEARNMYYRTHPRLNNDDDNHGNDDNHHL